MVEMRALMQVLKLCWLALIWWRLSFFQFLLIFMIQNAIKNVNGMFILIVENFPLQIGYCCWCWDIWWVIRYNFCYICIKSFKKQRQVGRTKTTGRGKLSTSSNVIIYPSCLPVYAFHPIHVGYFFCWKDTHFSSGHASKWVVLRIF